MNTPSTSTQPESIWDIFTHKYRLQKTLRFELLPQFETINYIESRNLIQARWEEDQNKVTGEDALRSENYTKLKTIFNEMHRVFLDEALSETNL